jgi:bifunctional oligoribonuclease and PAP phosphatase NrnA
MSVSAAVADQYQQVCDLIETNSEILIFGHKDADGDTLGCSLAFAEALKSVGKHVWVLIPPPLPQMYEWLPGFADIVEAPPETADPTLVLFFDAGNIERSGTAVRHIASHATVVNIDHHMSNTMFGDVNIINASAAAVGEMVIEMLDALGYPITASMATNLYTAIMTDTGGFRHENTTPESLESAARLARLGADPSFIATMVYKSRPMTTVRLSALALAQIETELDGRLIWSKVTRRMLHEAGARMNESEGIIDSLNSVAGMEVAILFKEVSGKITKLSIRSRGSVDAAALAALFGGGGHLRAAGAELQETVDAAIAKVLPAAREACLGNGRGPQRK